MKLGGIPNEQQNSVYNLLMSDQNIVIENSIIIVPNVPELIKQAAFYRKQSTRHAKDR